MSEWQEEADPSVMSSLGQIKMERCKPDYEAMVKKAQEQQKICQCMVEALEAYIERGDSVVSRGKLKELYGQIYFQHREYSRAIQQILEQQERDS